MNNTSCIFTVIKDEQEYLDEWIKYHLDLGINHIFVFEDIGSGSHKEIVNKYGDKVSLNTIGIFQFDEYKKHNNWDDSRQKAYNQEGLWWIKNNYNYGWCFAIDCDEYITIEDENNTLLDVLNMYSNYGAVILQWQNYNANGYVYKPNYNNEDLVKTYTQKCGKSPNDAIWKNTKLVYRLDRFKKYYFLGTHLCSDLCGWCKSDFSKELNKPIYSNIYIRHYITKSWEEYVWKLKIRGMFHKTHRDLDEFFQMNEGMTKRKEELMKIAEEIINNKT